LLACTGWEPLPSTESQGNCTKLLFFGLGAVLIDDKKGFCLDVFHDLCITGEEGLIPNFSGLQKASAIHISSLTANYAASRARWRAICARTCAGAVPPRVLRASRLPRRLSAANTSPPMLA